MRRLLAAMFGVRGDSKDEHTAERRQEEHQQQREDDVAHARLLLRHQRLERVNETRRRHGQCVLGEVDHPVQIQERHRRQAYVVVDAQYGQTAWITDLLMFESCASGALAAPFQSSGDGRVA
jgi:hypothetical protein